MITALVVILVILVIAGGIMLYVMSKSPSDKYGHGLRDHRKKITGGLKSSRIGKAIPSIINNGKKKIEAKWYSEEPKTYDNQKQKPEIKLTTEPIKAQAASNRGSDNPFENAPFHYDKRTCDNWKLGDTYIDDSGKEQYVVFTVQPYYYQGKLYLGLDHARIYDPNEFKPQTYQSENSPWEQTYH